MNYESHREDLIEILDGNLVASPTVGEQYVVRTVLLRMWNQTFASKRASRVLSESLDGLVWADNLDNIKTLILALDSALEQASEYRAQQMDIPSTDIINDIKAKTEFLGSTVNGLIQSSRLKAQPNPALSYPFEVLKTVDWHNIAHMTKYDADLVTILGFIGDNDYFDIAPLDVEIALAVS